MLNLPLQSNSVEKFFAPFDQVFQEILKDTPLAWKQYPSEPAMNHFSPAVEFYVDQEAGLYSCRAILPGVEPSEINVQVEGRFLTIRGERKSLMAGKQPEWLHSEVWYGTFKRTLTVPEAVNLDQIKAEYRNGVLEITAPLATSAMPRKIQVQAAAEPKQITS
jgi:HSP20 family molecular chaperone IbpA